MNKRFSISSLLFILIGLLVAIAMFYFGASSWGVFLGIVIIGIIIYFVGVIFCVIAFARKEKGLLKYIVAISVVIAIFCVGLN